MCPHKFIERYTFKIIQKYYLIIMTKNSIKPSNSLLREVNKLLRNNTAKNNGIKKLTRKLKSNHPEWNSNIITMGKVRQAKKILSIKNKSKRRKRKIPSVGLMRRIGKSLKGRHANSALKLALHPTSGLVTTLPSSVPSRFNYNNRSPGNLSLYRTNRNY